MDMVLLVSKAVVVEEVAGTTTMVRVEEKVAQDKTLWMRETYGISRYCEYCSGKDAVLRCFALAAFRWLGQTEEVIECGVSFFVVEMSTQQYQYVRS